MRSAVIAVTIFLPFTLCCGLLGLAETNYLFGTLFFGGAMAMLVAWAVIMRIKRSRQADATFGPECCQLAAPVDYEGRKGGVHTFTFYNREYARRFIGQNRDKVLG